MVRPPSQVVGLHNATSALVLSVTGIISIPKLPVKKVAGVQFASVLKPL